MKDLNGSEKDEMLTLMEEIQTENDGLLKEKKELEKENRNLQEINTKLTSQNSEARQMISDLSSKNSKMQNELQKKSGIIVSLNEKIEKLSGSDLVLKKNDELRKQNDELRRNEEETRRKAEAMISDFKEQAERDVRTVKVEYERKSADITNREMSAARREKKVTEREKNIQKEIKEKAEKITSKSLEKHQAEFNTLRQGYRVFVFFTLFYGVLVTILTICKTDTFVNECMSLMHFMGIGLKSIWSIVIMLGEIAAEAGNMISQAVLAMIVHWFLWGVFTILFITIICFAVFIVGYLYVDHLLRKQVDELSIFVGIVDLAVIVSLADEIKMLIPCNLIIVMLATFAVYTVIRGIIQMEDKEARNILLKWVVIILGIIATLVGVFRFFGYKGIGVVILATILTALNQQNGITY